MLIPKKCGKNERNEIYRKICNKGFTPEIKQTSVYGYGPWFPDHIPSSEAVRDLIGHLLKPKHRKRYTAEEALTHDWITKNAFVTKDLQTKHVSRQMMSRLMHFNNVCHFKLIITKIFRNQFYKMRPEHFHQLEQLFVQYDKDGDGVLTYEEFTEAMDASDIDIDQADLKRIYKGLLAPQQLEEEASGKAQSPQPPSNEEEKDGAKPEEVKPDEKPDEEAKPEPKEEEKDADDARPKPKEEAVEEEEAKNNQEDKPKNEDLMDMSTGIKFSDLLNALVYDYLIACDERLYDAFRKLDDDNNGYITAEELKKKLKQIDPLGEFERAIEIIDQNMTNDGLIDYETFLLNLHPNFNETPEWMPDVMKKMKSVAFIKPVNLRRRGRGGRGRGRGRGRRGRGH